MSRKLATIDTEVPLEMELNNACFGGFDNRRLQAMCEKYDFRSFLKRFDAVMPEIETKTTVIGPEDIAGIFKRGRIRVVDRSGRTYGLPSTARRILYFLLKRTLIDEGWDLQEILDALEPHTGKKIVVHDMKALMHIFGGGFTDAFDVMIADWVLDPSNSKYDIVSVLKPRETLHQRVLAARPGGKAEGRDQPKWA